MMTIENWLVIIAQHSALRSGPFQAVASAVLRVCLAALLVSFVSGDALGVRTRCEAATVAQTRFFLDPDRQCHGPEGQSAEGEIS